MNETLSLGLRSAHPKIGRKQHSPNLVGSDPTQRQIMLGSRKSRNRENPNAHLAGLAYGSLRRLATLGRADMSTRCSSVFWERAADKRCDAAIAETNCLPSRPARQRHVWHPHSLISLSDAGAHLTFFNDAGFGLHLMGHWVRDRGVMPLPEAVRRLTQQSARIFGLPGRGELREGHAADLLLFDPATVGRAPKRRVLDLPGGAARLTTDALGVHGVWVNGAQVADASGLLDAAPLAGELITEFSR